MSIRIDKEFESLIPPLDPEEFKQLEENCLKDGIRDALVVWHVPNGDDILIDGHNRFRISAKHSGIPFNIKRMTFEQRDDVKLWIIRNQFGRRNLSAYDRSVLALKLKPIIAKSAKAQQGARTDICQKSDRSPIDTKKEIAATAGVSHDTIHKVEAIQNSGDPRLIEQVRGGEISINKGYQLATGREVKTKSPARMRQDYIDTAKEAHEEFKGQKTVSIQQVREDRENQQIIASDLYSRLLGIGKRLEEVYTEMGAGDIDIPGMCKALPDEKKNVLTDSIKLWAKMLMALDKEVRSH